MSVDDALAHLERAEQGVERTAYHVNLARDPAADHVITDEELFTIISHTVLHMELAKRELEEVGDGRGERVEQLEERCANLEQALAAEAERSQRYALELEMYREQERR